MALNDVEEDLPYTMGRLIAGARNKKNISLEELSQGVMSVEDLNFIEKDDEYADKTSILIPYEALMRQLCTILLAVLPVLHILSCSQEKFDGLLPLYFLRYSAMQHIFDCVFLIGLPAVLAALYLRIS